MLIYFLLLLCQCYSPIHWPWPAVRNVHCSGWKLLLVTAVQPDRSCQVFVGAEKVYLSPFLASDANTDVACGSRDRPWLLEAPSGQRINVSLLDLSGSSSSTSSVQRARAVEAASSSRCVRQFGFIEDKSVNRNIDSCSDDAHRQQTLYVSHTNEVAIVLHPAQQTTANFLIAVKGLSHTLIEILSCNWLSE